MSTCPYISSEHRFIPCDFKVANVALPPETGVFYTNSKYNPGLILFGPKYYVQADVGGGYRGCSEQSRFK